MDSEMIERLVAIQIKHNPQTKIGAAIVIVDLLTAMREPTENMKIAGSIDPGSGGPDEGYETEVWQAMLDAIIENNI